MPKEKNHALLFSVFALDENPKFELLAPSLYAMCFFLSSLNALRNFKILIEKTTQSEI